MLLPGIYAWFITVVPLVAFRAQSPWPLVTASLALVSLFVGASLLNRPTIAHAVGIWGFLLACLATWLLTPLYWLERLDPWRAAAGSLGWILFALGWGTPWRLGHHPEDNPRASLSPKLEPRTRARRSSLVAVAIGSLGALSTMMLAWRATAPERALFLHGAAFACAIAMLNASAAVALSLSKNRIPFSPRQRISYAFPWVMAISALVVVAIAWWLGS